MKQNQQKAMWAKQGRIVKTNDGLTFRDEPVILVQKNPTKGVAFSVTQGGRQVGAHAKKDLDHIIKLRQELRKKAGLKSARIVHR